MLKKSGILTKEEKKKKDMRNVAYLARGTNRLGSEKNRWSILAPKREHETTATGLFSGLFSPPPHPTATNFTATTQGHFVLTPVSLASKDKMAAHRT